MGSVFSCVPASISQMLPGPGTAVLRGRTGGFGGVLNHRWYVVVENEVVRWARRWEN
ncbi:MAG TPA: hypothetical protein VHW70_01295 [Edaphobacter sp.]|nr:hypothetical protein [Edaphobacter sp.]